MRTSARVQAQKVKPQEAPKEEPAKKGARKAEKTAKKEAENAEKRKKSAERSVSKEKEDKKGKKKALKKEKEEERSPSPKQEDTKKRKRGGKEDLEKKKEDEHRKAQKKDEDDAKKVKVDDDAKKSQKKAKDDDDSKKPQKKDEEPKKDDSKEQKDEKMVKLIAKGGYVVDHLCPIKKAVHVYVSASKAYDATLNQSNVSHNNNKFYIIQLLQDDADPNLFYVWNRWGRVGVPGQNMCKGPLALNTAIKEYEDKLYDKTVKGDYRILEIVNEEEKPEENKKDEEKKEDKSKDDFEKSKLPTPVKNLVQLIFDLKMMNNQMKEIGYDAKKMPLGKLSKSNIEKGYKILSDIAECLKKGNAKSQIEKLSSDFYSYIPHDFGFQKMYNFILDTEKKVKDKLEMLQSISDIQIATKLLEDVSKSDNAVDDHYEKLKCTIIPVPSSSAEFKIVQDYVKNTHAATHSSYNLEILDLFTVRREGEYEAYETHSKDIPNKMLLWHGSRLTNYVGILSQGLRIAPPEAPSTGYMFGKGVYFADMVSKSANYCYANAQSNVSCMLLCEVALGNMNEKLYADYNANILPIGKHSTKGCGKTAPSEAGTVEMDGIKVPIGNSAPTNIPQKKIFAPYFVNELILQGKLQGLDVERVFSQNVTSEEYNLTLSEPLGPSLKQLFQLCDYNFSVSCICNIGIQLIKLVQKIHSRKVVHSNLNPSKIMIGLEEPGKLFISDFSRAVCFDIEVRKPVKAGQALTKSRKGIDKIGVFSGRNVLNGTTPNNFDDLDAILYILLYLFTGKDWIKSEIDNYGNLAYEGRNKAIGTYKLITSNEVLCKKAPKLFMEFCKYVRELREGEIIDYSGMAATLRLVAANLETAQNPADSKAKFTWLTNDKLDELLKNFNITNIRNSPGGSPSNRSPSNRDTKGLSTFSKAAVLNVGSGSPSNKNNGALGFGDKYNQLKLARITEESFSEKKESVSEKISNFNKNSEFVFKNSFNSGKSPDNNASESVNKEPAFEEGGSPNKSDYAMFQLKKEELCFSNMLKET